MSTGEQVQGHREVSEAEGRAELDRLLEDSRFHGTDRTKCILKYLAERRFNGCDEAVKAYSIALDVLGRHASFDASSDPIVRIEMSRLRSSLTQYYEAFGNECGISIHLPIGRYLAVFSRTAPVDDAGAEEAEADVRGRVCTPPEGQSFLPPSRRLLHIYTAGTAVLVLAMVGLAGAAWYGSQSGMTARPAVMLAISSAQEDNAEEAEATGDYLITALSRFRTLDISSQETMPTGSTSRRARPAAGNSYDIDMKYYSDNDDRTMWWQVVDSHGGGILKSGVEKVEADGREEAVVRGDLVARLAKRFASTRGVINVLEAQDGAASNALGNTCVLRAEYELDEGGRLGIRSALPCLERTVALQPANSDALAVLARVIVAAEGGNPATTPFDRALTMANRAASLDPTSDRAQVAIMMAQFYAGRTEAAIAAGNQALALNPNNPDVLSKLAGVLYSAGFRDAAVSLAEDAGKDVDAFPRDARIVLALDAFQRGDYSNASLVSEQINCGDVVVRAIRAAALGEMASPGAKASLDYLKRMLPDYRTALPERMRWRRYPDPMIASLEQGLAKAEQVKAGLSRAVASAN
jgi:tetratricopeptide (TPR) repeat protein